MTKQSTRNITILLYAVGILLVITDIFLSDLFGEKANKFINYGMIITLVAIVVREIYLRSK
jgi:hypothetical protein